MGLADLPMAGGDEGLRRGNTGLPNATLPVCRAPVPEASISSECTDWRRFARGGAGRIQGRTVCPVRQGEAGGDCRSTPERYAGDLRGEVRRKSVSGRHDRPAVARLQLLQRPRSTSSGFAPPRRSPLPASRRSRCPVSQRSVPVPSPATAVATSPPLPQCAPLPGAATSPRPARHTPRGGPHLQASRQPTSGRTTFSHNLQNDANGAHPRSQAQRRRPAPADPKSEVSAPDRAMTAPDRAMSAPDGAVSAPCRTR